MCYSTIIMHNSFADRYDLSSRDKLYNDMIPKSGTDVNCRVTWMGARTDSTDKVVYHDFGGEFKDERSKKELG